MKKALPAVVLTWAVVLGMWIAALLVSDSLPERIPVHWNIDGEVDRYGGKWEVTVLIPLLATILGVGLFLVPRIDRRADFAPSMAAFSAMRLGVVAVLAVVHACLLAVAAGKRVDVVAVVFVAVGLLLSVVGNLMGKLRRNWFAGVRTPWTRCSSLSWQKSNRLGGPLLMISGLAFVLAGLVGTRLLMVAAFAVLFVSIPALVVYSYVVWRSDPDREPVAGGGVGSSPQQGPGE